MTVSPSKRLGACVPSASFSRTRLPFDLVFAESEPPSDSSPAVDVAGGGFTSGVAAAAGAGVAVSAVAKLGTTAPATYINNNTAVFKFEAFAFISCLSHEDFARTGAISWPDNASIFHRFDHSCRTIVSN